MATGGDPSQPPFDNDLTQQVLTGERRPRIQLDLAASM
jgi:hypothetical protein